MSSDSCRKYDCQSLKRIGDEHVITLKCLCYIDICLFASITVECLMTKQQLPNVFLNQKGLTVTVFLPSIQIRVLTSEKNVVSRSKRSLSWISYKFLYTIFKVL